MHMKTKNSIMNPMYPLLNFTSYQYMTNLVLLSPNFIKYFYLINPSSLIPLTIQSVFKFPQLSNKYLSTTGLFKSEFMCN